MTELKYRNDSLVDTAEIEAYRDIYSLRIYIYIYGDFRLKSCVIIIITSL